MPGGPDVGGARRGAEDRPVRHPNAQVDRVLAEVEADRQLDAARRPRDVVGIGVDDQFVVVTAVLEPDVGRLDLALRTIAGATQDHDRLASVRRLDGDVAPRQLHSDPELPRRLERLSPHRRILGLRRRGGRVSVRCSMYWGGTREIIASSFQLFANPVSRLPTRGPRTGAETSRDRARTIHVLADTPSRAAAASTLALSGSGSLRVIRADEASSA
jgi:hypothetical protein